MKAIESFGFDDLVGVVAEPPPTSETPPWEDQAEPLTQWAGDVVCQAVARAGGPVIFDIETGPRSEDELRAVFREKTLEEFSADCDKRWKPETVAAKYEAYKVDAWDEFVRRAALSPLTGRVLLIGVTDEQGPPQFIFGDEPDMLAIFWMKVEEWLAERRPIIGHNSATFDIPFLVRRSWALGVPVPREVRQGQYWNPLFHDTMEWWACGSRDFVRLNTLGKFFGVGQKTEGVSGGDFAKLWFGQMPAETWGTADEQRVKAIEYNGQDLKLTAAIAAKMGMM